jgi:aspartate aminotransferase
MVKLVKTATEFELSPTLGMNEEVKRQRGAGKQVMHMGFGEGPFPVPERLKKALAENVHRKEYLPTVGMEQLRTVVADYYKKKIGLDTDKFDVIVAPGSKLILYALQMAVEGDLLMPVPSWVSYAPQAKMLNTKVIKVPTTLDDKGFHIDPAQLRDLDQIIAQRGLEPEQDHSELPEQPDRFEHS